MKILLASAEIAPIARVGGMAEAVAGLVKQLRQNNIDVSVVLPDYGGVELTNEVVSELPMPAWASPGSVRSGEVEGVGAIHLIDVPWIEKAHPYNDANGVAFEDNDLRFLGFSAAVAALTVKESPDVLHLNDWHTAATLGFLNEPPPSVLSIHNLGYQGIANPGWLDEITNRPHYFAWHNTINPLLGGLRLADRVVTVSPNYSKEILSEEDGMGLHEYLIDLGDRLVGIVNGIDTAEWNPHTDSFLEKKFSIKNKAGKSANKKKLLTEFGLDHDSSVPVIGMVSRLVEQKGIDLITELARFIPNLPAKLVILGSGDIRLVNEIQQQVAQNHEHISFRNDYDLKLGHQVFAGSDLLLMPSRFEPCGLAQMQAMAYGTIPVTTNVGGLADTVIDADLFPETGNGFVSQSIDSIGLLDALYRATRAWRNRSQRAAIQRRGMETDWSWTEPAKQYLQLYNELATNSDR